MKFLCDQMLAGLGKWLRAAGHDTAVAGYGEREGGLLERAQAEGRVLLTCSRRREPDRKTGAARVVVLDSNGPRRAAPELTRRLAVDWLYAPFTRCLEDNSPLRSARAAERRKIPTAARHLPGPVMACPACGRVYWPGSHYRRMRRRLAGWQSGATGGGNDPSADDTDRECIRPEAGTGPGTAERHILHVDMDAFFAAIEQHRHPELRGRPVIVGGKGDPRSRGVVSAASYEARRFGVRSGMPLAQTYRTCPEAVFLPVDLEAYVTVSRRVMAILRDFSRRIEPRGLDEAFLDVTRAGSPAMEIARAIKQRVRYETGLTCSVGVAPNKLLAKIASAMDKPDGLTAIDRSDVEQRIWPLPARAIPGIGPRTEKRLAAIGVHTIGDLAAIPREAIVARFGEARGVHFSEAARGIDNSPVTPRRERKSLGHETTFERDFDDPAALRRVLRELADVVAAEARESRLRGRTVSVKLRYADFVTATRCTTLRRPVSSVRALRRAARDCFERFPLDRPVRLLALRLSGLQRR